MDVLRYEGHLDYDIAQSTNPDFNKAIVRVNVFNQLREIIQDYPGESRIILPERQS